MSTSTLSDSIPAALLPWLDAQLIPVYAIVGISTYFLGRYVDRTYIRSPSKSGFGKGAPGFMTNTRQLRVTPDIARRLRAGEYVSPEEIAACQTAADAPPASSSAVSTTEASSKKTKKQLEKEKEAEERERRKREKEAKKAREAESSDANEWIPQEHIKASARRRQR